MKLLIIILSLTASCFAVDFNKDIKPILSRKCFNCHGKQKQKGKLRLDIRMSALKALKADKNGKISLLDRIHNEDPEEIMPPPEEEALSEKEKELLKLWIDNEAPYGTHWSFIPPSKISPPEIKDSWIANDIDKFILKKMAESKLKPNDVKFNYQLFRRISLLLTGLPPNDEAYQKFSEGKLKYSEYVESLLKSSAYGEHMASMWLDSARYGDTNGMQYDNSRPIWPYRDWVIKAFNKNMPYDQFLTEQLAGDLLDNPTISQKVATGFLRCNVTTNEMGSIEEEFRARNTKDRINTSMLTFTGLTFNCAECHDHKYDPISQKEYYQLLAYFNNIDGLAVGFPYERADEPIIPVLNKEKNLKFEALNKKSDSLNMKMEKLKKKSADAFWWWHYQTLSSPPKVIYLMGSLDSFLPFDEKSGSYTNDLISETQCNIKGIPFRNKGKFGKSLRFNSRAYVINQSAGSFSKSIPFSIGCWLNPEIDNRGTIAGRFDTLKQIGWKMTIEDGYVSIHLKSSPTEALIVKSTKQIDIDKWSHVTVVYDGKGKANGIKIFINGEETKLKTLTDNLKNDFALKTSMLIGIESVQGWLTYCSVDELFTAKKALNQEQIKSISQFKSASRFALIPPNKLSPKFKEELWDYYLKFHHEEYSKLYKQDLKIKEQIQEILTTSTTSMVMKEKKEIDKTFILERGDYEKPLQQVERSLPQFLKIKNAEFENNRLGLAKWLLHKEHPLTARVLVNRIWQKFLGDGLVKTPEDFGNQGDFPTHPKLLDYLANYLVENNWDIQKLIRFIVHSSTFKQSSKLDKTKLSVDPENRYYSYFKRRRLPAESIRDQALFVSGLLVDKVGGAPVFPYQPEGLWKEVTFDISNTRKYEQSEGKDNYRKSIYSFWKKNLPPPAMTIFDAPYRQNCKLKRNYSNTPLQALVLLNDPQFTETYNSLYKLFSDKGLSNNTLINEIFVKLFRRLPSKHEVKYSMELLKSENCRLLIHSLMNTDEFISVE